MPQAPCLISWARLAVTGLRRPCPHSLRLADCSMHRLTSMVENGEHMMFVYGTLKPGQPNNATLLQADTGRAEFVGKGTTSGKYPLVIAGKYNIPYLLYVPGEGHYISGTIYKVDTKKRDFMDDFESHPTYYERMEEDIIVTDDESSGETKTVKCWVYFMKNYLPQMLELPRWPSYDTLGPHGLRYVESEDSEDLSDVL